MAKFRIDGNNIYLVYKNELIPISATSIMKLAALIDPVTMNVIQNGCNSTWKPTKKTDEFGNIIERARPSNST